MSSSSFSDLPSSTVAATALSMPRFRSIGFMPAATNFMPSRTMACASTVAVVVPSPALSLVLEATSLTICAPMFCSLSFSSISLATDTPSLVTVGAPNERSSTTLRPLGPSVTLTALARMFTPSTMRARASAPKMTSLAAMRCFSGFSEWGVQDGGGTCPRPGHSPPGRRSCPPAWSAKRCAPRRELLFDDGEEVFFAHHEQFVAIDLDGLAAVLAEQHAIAHLDVQSDEHTLVIALARADGQDFALIRLFSSGVGDDDARGGLGFLFQTLDDNTVVQRTKLHFISFMHSQ